MFAVFADPFLFSSSRPGLSRAARHIMELPEQLRSTPAISLALSINRAYLEQNPVRLLRLAQRLNFLQSCALHRHLVTSRRDLLHIFSHGFSSRNCRFPLHGLAQLLFLDESLTVQLCRSYGVEVTQDDQVVFSKTAFTEPEQGKLHCKRYHSIVAEKQRDLTVRSIIDGCAWDNGGEWCIPPLMSNSPLKFNQAEPNSHTLRCVDFSLLNL